VETGGVSEGLCPKHIGEEMGTRTALNGLNDYEASLTDSVGRSLRSFLCDPCVPALHANCLANRSGP
jgi:hypothetical protein